MNGISNHEPPSVLGALNAVAKKGFEPEANQSIIQDPSKNIDLKRISDLANMTFFVEKYQRGYKWDIQQVLDLLNDINEFKQVGSSFYCLQPVVVTKMNAADERVCKRLIHSKDYVYELIDGQQRLTTIFILLSILDGERSLYQIIYRTRPESERFLNQINALSPVHLDCMKQSIAELNRYLNNSWTFYLESFPHNNNVDNYHFYKAFQIIKGWLELVDKDAFKQKLLNEVKIIWYNLQPKGSPDEIIIPITDAEKVFINFNQGKIQLEQAELIKALFVLKFNEIANVEIRNLQVNQFSDDWNKIESQLQDNRFWFFVSNDVSDKRRYNRIDLLFDIISNNPRRSDDAIFAYHFYLSSNQTIDQTLQNWKDVKNLFELIWQWYQDRLLYHLIGIIVYLDINTIAGLLDIYKNTQTVTSKDQFEAQLKSLIGEELAKEKYLLSKLDYKSAEETKAILHLFNIFTYHTCDFNYRYPFDKLKTQHWSLEHIHAQNAEAFIEKKEYIEWLNDLLPLLEELENKTKLENCKRLLVSLDLNNIKDLKPELIQFGQEIRSDLDLDHISNLCLLEKNTNSSLGNEIFVKKRSKILKIDSAGQVEVAGTIHKTFIPICTKNVFLKYYLSNPADVQFTYWGNHDREDYFSCIESQITQFLSNDK